MKTYRFKGNRVVKALKFSLTLASLTVVLAHEADAALYQLNFSDNQGGVGSGQIDVVEVIMGGGSNYEAVSGYLDVTGGGASGSWALYTAGGATTFPNYFYSPSGAYVYNNAVYPDGNNPQYGGVVSLLDNYGLLFTQINGNELNLWGNPNGSYTLGGNVGGWQNFNVAINIDGSGGSGGASLPIIAPVPEPGTLALFLSGGFVLLAGIQRTRKNR